MRAGGCPRARPLRGGHSLSLEWLSQDTQVLEDVSMSKEQLGKIPAVAMKTARVWPHSLAMLDRNVCFCESRNAPEMALSVTWSR